jgi:hypothetical protein
MTEQSAKQGGGVADGLHAKLLEADDRKIRRILAVVDEVADPEINRTLLDPLRHRLASLKPVRPLRFARLLFIPLDPLLVPPRAWRPDEATLPRSILTPIARTVRAGLGSLAPYIDQIVAGGKGDMSRAITEAGEALWPRAAEILDRSPPPLDWPGTGLPHAAYGPLATNIAAVLRRAQYLRRLARDEEIGTQESNAEVMDEILRDIANESEVGCAMIARLILVRSPRAAKLLRRIVTATRSQAEKALMQKAMDHGLDLALSHMERDTGFVDMIGHGVLAEVSDEVRRVTTLLREVESDPGSSGHWPRVKAIREKLSDVCQDRFIRGVQENLVAPLEAAAGPVDGAGQTELEARARELRKLDAVARKIGRPADYDRQLMVASEAVRAAAEAGTLTPMRKLRLIEMLAGSDAAEALYVKASAKR